MLKNLFASTVYVRIYPNRFGLRHIESGREIDMDAPEPFTSQRLLVGNFTVAQALLQKALKELAGRNLIAASPVMLIHPMEKIEGGLSQIEERSLQELGRGAGARKVRIYTGKVLSDVEVGAKLREK